MKKVSPYEKQVKGKSPDCTLGYLFLADICRPEFKQRFHPGVFTLLLKTVISEAYNVQKNKDQTVRWSAKVDPLFLIDSTIKILKRKIKHPRHQRRHALDYLKLVEQAWFLTIKKPEDKEYWIVTFIDQNDWIYNTQTLLINNGTIKSYNLSKLGRLNSMHCEMLWYYFFPNKEKLKHFEEGNCCLAEVDPRKFTARRWNTYSHEVVTEHVRAELGGANDYHWKSPRYKEIRGIRTIRLAIERKKLTEKKEIIKENIDIHLEEVKPNRQTWPISNAMAANLFGHSHSTQVRRVANEHIVIKKRQAQRVGYANVASKLRIAAYMKKTERRPFRFIPHRNDRSQFQVQVDLPSKFKYRKHYGGFAFRHVPPELWVGTDGSAPRRETFTPEEKKAGTRLTSSLMQKEFKSNRGEERWKGQAKVLLCSNIHTLGYLPTTYRDELLWAELQRLGMVGVVPTFWKKQIEIGPRPSHHGPRRRANGMWQNQFAKNENKEHPSKRVNRRKKRSRKRRNQWVVTEEDLAFLKSEYARQLRHLMANPTIVRLE